MRYGESWPNSSSLLRWIPLVPGKRPHLPTFHCHYSTKMGSEVEFFLREPPSNRIEKRPASEEEIEDPGFSFKSSSRKNIHIHSSIFFDEEGTSVVEPDKSAVIIVAQRPIWLLQCRLIPFVRGSVASKRFVTFFHTTETDLNLWTRSFWRLLEINVLERRTTGMHGLGDRSPPKNRWSKFPPIEKSESRISSIAPIP